MTMACILFGTKSICQTSPYSSTAFSCFLPAASDVTNIWAERVTVTTDVRGIFGDRPTTDGAASLRAVAWMVNSHNFFR